MFTMVIENENEINDSFIHSFFKVKKTLFVYIKNHFVNKNQSRLYDTFAFKNQMVSYFI